MELLIREPEILIFANRKVLVFFYLDISLLLSLYKMAAGFVRIWPLCKFANFLYMYRCALNGNDEYSVWDIHVNILNQ